MVNNKQLRRFLFTMYPKPDADQDALFPVTITTTDVTYYVWQYERGNAEHRLHAQGFVQLSRRLRINQIRALVFAGYHEVHMVEVTRTPDAAREYCMKLGDDGRVDGTEYTEFGQFVTDEARGERSDLDHAVEAIQGGMSGEDLRLKHSGVCARADRYIQRLYGDVTRKLGRRLRRNLEVFVFIGTTALGKSRRARYEAERDYGADSLYCVECTSPIWYDGYAGEPVVLLDDMGPNWFGIQRWTPEWFLRFLDIYELRLNVKGGHTWMCAERIYITSNLPVSEWVSCISMVHLQALERRLTNIEVFTDEWRPGDVCFGV